MSVLDGLAVLIERPLWEILSHRPTDRWPTAADRVSSTVRYRERQTRGQTCRGADRRSLLANGSGADTVNPGASATTGILA